ncbi:MAG: hypothetical protein IJ636_02710, partial [Bacteroidales bacterium]|nr:hypothetical protein [Bacteroidales bacterium]
MKRLLLLFLLLIIPFLVRAQQRTVERTYIATDKDVYVAGERVWCSAFCVTPSGALSGISRVAYLELHAADALAATARIDLENGRGAGALELPGDLPTGNYRLIAYTAQDKAEKGYDYEGIASKTISVFNVLTTDRVKDGVEIVSGEEYARIAAERSQAPATASAAVELRWENGQLHLLNRSGEALSLSLSVYHDDGILSNGNPGIGDFLASVRQVRPADFDNNVIPDYEGEVIGGRVVGFSSEMLPQLIGKYAFLSSPSD